MKPSELLATPERWTKGAFARTKDGDIIGPNAANATCFCILGALRACDVTGKHQWVWENLLCGKLQEQGSELSVPSWQDEPERTHAEVLALLKEVGL